MLNTGAMLAILTTITLDDYHTDQIREKRQKMQTYADSMKSIGDNVRLWGVSITDTLRDSGGQIWSKASCRGRRNSRFIFLLR